jgi:hypothetical protein
VGFTTARTAGQEVNREWGATNGGKVDFDGSGRALGDELFDFVSTIGSSGVVQFPGTSYDGPAGLDGPQGGLLDDAAARGGAGIVDRSIIFTIIVDADPGTGGNQGLLAAQQTAFLNSVATDLADHVQLARQLRATGPRAGDSRARRARSRRARARGSRAPEG